MLSKKKRDALTTCADYPRPGHSECELCQEGYAKQWLNGSNVIASHLNVARQQSNTLPSDDNENWNFKFQKTCEKCLVSLQLAGQRNDRDRSHYVIGSCLMFEFKSAVAPWMKAH